MKTIFSKGIIASFLISFITMNATRSEIEKEAFQQFPLIFGKTLQAHGGLEKWNSFGSLFFNEVVGNDTTKHIIDLKNRNERIEKTGVYKIGFTHDSISFYPNRDSFPGKNPRFIHNLAFYFFAIHFVTADPGANQHEIEPAELDGILYNRVKITFGDGVGYSPKDQYILWYDQKTNLLKMINYSVTYYDVSRAEKYSAIVYDKWVNSNGLLMPAEITGYTWENNSLGKKRYKKLFSQISFSTKRPSQDTFIDVSK